MKKYIITLLVLLLVFGCINEPPKPKEVLIANYGDNVVVDYTLWVDGKIVDTSIASVAQSAGIYQSSVPYQPLNFKVLHGLGLINGFVDGVVGMKEGEVKNVTISPAAGYGMPDAKNMKNYSMHFNQSVYEEVPLAALQGKGFNLTVGSVLQTQQGLIAIWDIDNATSTVTLRHLFFEGSKLTTISDGSYLYMFPQTVEKVENDTVYITFDVVENKTYSVVNPTTGAVAYATVRHVTNESFILDKNHPYAGKTLLFELAMRTITKAQTGNSS